jgi:menaquinone-dependent protoporphyrinogen oxidase
MRALILYATGEGQTATIAQRIVKRLAAQHVPADCHNVADESEAPVALESYDAVVAGSSIHYGHFDAVLGDYLAAHRDTLRQLPTGFFSVSMAVASDNADEVQHVQSIADEYLHDTGWHPDLVGHFAGAIKYTKYRWWTRRIMRSIARKEGGPTDVRFDYEFTRWNEVDAFADRFVALIKQQLGGHSDVWATGTQRLECSTGHPGHAADRHAVQLRTSGR